MTNPILSVEDLLTSFTTDEGIVQAVSRVSFTLQPGKTLGLVGESGCGKSVTALSIMRLLPRPWGTLVSGRIRFKGIDLVALTPDAMRAIRGKRIAMIFQEPMTALNPVHRIGKQLEEVFRIHFPDRGKTRVREEALSLLQRVGIPDPERCLKAYPHQISGGMRQRVMIAMALAGSPEILIADEPTTALDVTIQAQILELIQSLQAETGMTVLFITHDLGVIAEICDDVVVMYAGTIAERAPVNTLFFTPAHPYTRGLLGSIPRLDSPRKTALPTIKGMVPDLLHLPSGCRFENRCPEAMDVCRSIAPILTRIGEDHWVSCHLYPQGSSHDPAPA